LYLYTLSRSVAREGVCVVYRQGVLLFTDVIMHGLVVCSSKTVVQRKHVTCMCEQIPYSVISAECYFEVCPSKDFGNVRSRFTYVGEDGPLFLRCLCHLFLPLGVDRGFLGFDGERIVMEDVDDV